MTLHLARRASAAAVGGLVLCAVLLGGSTRADALSLAPTDWSSTVDSVAPADVPVEITMFTGGEAIRVRALPGHEVIVPGYRREPYLRIAPDGATYVNVRSPAVAMNSTATGTSSDAAADASAPPDWVRLDHQGWVQWHDHRIHAMPGVSSPLHWNLPIIVDGQVVAIDGTLREDVPEHSTILVLLAGLVTALTIGATLLAALRTHHETVAARAALIGSLLATWSSTVVWITTPTGFDPPLPLAILAGAAIFASVVALRPSPVRLVSTFVSVAALCGWVAIQWTLLTSAHVPASSAANPRWLVLALVSGLAIGSGIAGVRSVGADHAEIAPR